MLDFKKHLNSTFRKKEVLFTIFDSFELGIKWPSLTVLWLGYVVFYNYFLYDFMIL